ncbi:MAG: ribosome silencing factor [Bacteroidales bacterium]|nr:ribosome silencing factor [Bacteroidales bacterium]MCF8332631.1 ribosome silencing factor [Bacteroidales bacterium]
MVFLKRQEETKTVVDTIKQALIDKKAKGITIIYLGKIENAVSDYFIVTHGTSDTHVEALAKAVVEETEEKRDAKPWHIEGMKNKEWILLDYSDIVVHIFQPYMRDFYRLEELWADADIEYAGEE